MAKYNGSKLECSEERINALMVEYDRCIMSCSVVRRHEIFKKIVNSPCNRFWVSGFRAAVVMAGIMRGDDLSGMRPLKREMFHEIYRRVLELQKRHPDYSLYRLACLAVLQPAPKFYMSPSSAKIMFYKAKKEWYRRKGLLRKYSH